MAQLPDEPLTLTVHSLPQLDQASARSAAATRSGRWKMLALFLVCATPVIASYFTYYVIRPEGRRNYGELIQPQRPIPAVTGVNAAGQTVPLASLKDQWLLISVADSACDAACQEHLLLQRQLRETLGREKDRLDWVWLRTGDAPLTEPLRWPPPRPTCCGSTPPSSPAGWSPRPVSAWRITCTWSIRWATG